MSTYGLNIVNDAGVVICDSDNYSAGLILTGTATDSSATGVTVTFSNTVIKPLVFLNFNSSTKFVTVEVLSTTSVKFSFWTYNGINYQPTQTTGSVGYQIYGHVRYAYSADIYGMIVYDSSGNKVMDTTLLSLKIRYTNQNVNLSAGTANTGDAFHITQVSLTGHGVGGTPYFLANAFSGQAGLSTTFGAVGQVRDYYFMGRINGSNFELSALCGSVLAMTMYSGFNPAKEHYFSPIPIAFY